MHTDDINEPVSIEAFVTWATMVAASYDEAERKDVIERIVWGEEGHSDLCACCVLRFNVEREIARGEGVDLAPLVNLREPRVQ